MGLLGPRFEGERGGVRDGAKAGRTLNRRRRRRLPPPTAHLGIVRDDDVPLAGPDAHATARGACTRAAAVGRSTNQPRPQPLQAIKGARRRDPVAAHSRKLGLLFFLAAGRGGGGAGGGASQGGACSSSGGLDVRRERRCAAGSGSGRRTRLIRLEACWGVPCCCGYWLVRSGGPWQCPRRAGAGDGARAAACHLGACMDALAASQRRSQRPAHCARDPGTGAGTHKRKQHRCPPRPRGGWSGYAGGRPPADSQRPGRGPGPAPALRQAPGEPGQGPASPGSWPCRARPRPCSPSPLLTTTPRPCRSAWP